MSVQISAVICTYNRANYLPKAIRSLVDQALDKSLYEIIVVNNGSTDNTKSVMTDEFSQIQNLVYVERQILGLSRARNTGWKKARGDYVAYLDDDAVAYPNWLEKILDVFETVKPKPGCVCGKVEPLWEAPRPPWLSDEVAASLTIVDWSSEPVILRAEEWIAGTNMSFPKSLLEGVGGFEENLGRKGNKLLSMEEILLRQQLQESGYCCYYHPEIAVRHHVPPSRLTKRWFVRRWYWQGVSDAITRVHLESLKPFDRIRMVASAAIKLMRSPRHLLNLVASTNDPRRFELKCVTLRKIGYIFGMLAIAK